LDGIQALDGKFKAIIKYTCDDDFGLDKGDITRQNGFGAFLYKDYLRSWYILQHYRCYHPFEVEVEITDANVSGLSK